jgi:hypothetical protein
MASEQPLHPEYPEFDTEHTTDRDINRDTDYDTDLEFETTIGKTRS